MKDSRVKWIDSRWGRGFQVFIDFPIASILCYLFIFIVPEIFIPVSTIFGFSMSVYTIMMIFFTLFGGLFWLLISLGTSRYSEYISMKSPYLIPYILENNTWYRKSVIDDNGKYNNIEWRDNEKFYAKLYLETDSEHKDENYLTFSEINNNYLYFMSKEYLEDIYSYLNGHTLEGYFIVERRYNRYQTIYSLKYLGKE